MTVHRISDDSARVELLLGAARIDEIDKGSSGQAVEISVIVNQTLRQPLCDLRCNALSAARLIIDEEARRAGEDAQKIRNGR